MEDLVRRLYRRWFHRFLVFVYTITLAYHGYYGWFRHDDDFLD